MSARCRRYGISPAGFYAWQQRGESTRAGQDRILSSQITTLFTAHEHRYGSPRIHRALRQAGCRVSRRRVARLMRAAALCAKAVRGYRPKARIHRQYARHPNRLWATTITRPNQVWIGDLTYLRVDRSWRYLAVVMDHYSRPTTGLIFHSDRGPEYLGAPFSAHVARLGILQSASVRGPRDNSHMESLFHSLKAELTHGVVFSTDKQLRSALRRYIRYDNVTRLHSAFGYLSPIAFECQAA